MNDFLGVLVSEGSLKLVVPRKGLHFLLVLNARMQNYFETWIKPSSDLGPRASTKVSFYLYLEVRFSRIALCVVLLYKRLRVCKYFLQQHTDLLRIFIDHQKPPRKFCELSSARSTYVTISLPCLTVAQSKGIKTEVQF